MPTDRPHNLLIEFFSSDPSPEAVHAIEAWVREDPANARILAELIMLDGQMLADQKNQDAKAILQVLLEDAAKAPLNLIEVETQQPGGRLAALFRDPNSRLFAIAAVLLVVCSLGLWAISSALSGADQPDKVAPAPAPQTSTPAAVATLTHQRDARWQVDAAADQPGIGDALYAGQRLTLSAGSAHITIAQGAQVLLQAPCSIEMTGGDNALRLVRGELSARIDNKQAQGFTVYLPQNSRIVDLGTAFRVAVDASGQADCLVTEGKVLWQPDGQDDASAVIVAGQSARLVAGRPVVADVDYVFVEDFDGYTSAEENFNGGQHQTGLAFAHLGTLKGWTHTGYNSLHAVDHANRFGDKARQPNYAAMVIYGHLQAAVNGANEAGKVYEVSFRAGPAVYLEPLKATSSDDRLVFELVRRDGSILATHEHRPGAWSGQMTLYPDRFTYRGDGSGQLALRVRSADRSLNDISNSSETKNHANARFAGAIDDLAIRVIDASSNSSTDRGNEQP